jgi:TfoX/Sxy family transcriptional regulator of competence genes
MAYSNELAERIREQMGIYDHVTERKMFGGICFMVGGHMTVGIVDDKLMTRHDPAKDQDYLAMEHVTPMDFTGKPMKGKGYVEADGIESDEDLALWIGRCVEFVLTLPPKKPKTKKKKA